MHADSPANVGGVNNREKTRAIAMPSPIRVLTLASPARTWVWAAVEPRGRSWAFADAPGVVRALYDSAGIDLSRRGMLISRIGVLLQGLDEDGLIWVGKCAANK